MSSKKVRIEEGTPSQGIPVTAAALPPPVSPSQELEGTRVGSHVSAAAPPPLVSPSQDSEENKEGLKVDATAPSPPPSETPERDPDGLSGWSGMAESVYHYYYCL